MGYDGRFFAFVVTLSLSLLTGNLVLLLGGIGFLAVLPLSYYRQKELFWRKRRKKNDCGKLNGNSKGRRLSKMSSTKLKPTIIHGLCRKLKPRSVIYAKGIVENDALCLIGIIYQLSVFGFLWLRRIWSSGVKTAGLRAITYCGRSFLTSSAGLPKAAALMRIFCLVRPKHAG